VYRRVSPLCDVRPLVTVCLPRTCHAALLLHRSRRCGSLPLTCDVLCARIARLAMFRAAWLPLRLPVPRTRQVIHNLRTHQAVPEPACAPSRRAHPATRLLAHLAACPCRLISGAIISLMLDDSTAVPLFPLLPYQ
jgi:hypothetical protein